MFCRFKNGYSYNLGYMITKDAFMKRNLSRCVFHQMFYVSRQNTAYFLKCIQKDMHLDLRESFE